MSILQWIVVATGVVMVAYCAFNAVNNRSIERAWGNRQTWCLLAFMYFVIALDIWDAVA